MSTSIARSVAKNMSLGMIQQMTTWVSTFLLMMFLPRYLGSVEYGRLFLASSIAGIFLIFVDYDGRSSIAKMVARSHKDVGTILMNSLGFRLAFWIAAFIGMNIFAAVTGYRDAEKILVAIFGIEMAWRGATTVIGGGFVGLEDFRYNVIGAIVERGFISLAGIVALLLGAQALTIAVIMVTGTLLNFLVVAFAMRRIVVKVPAIDWQASRGMIRRGIPYFLFSIFGTIYYRIDSIMLSLMTPEAVVGWYGAAYRFFDLLNFLPTIFSGAVLPVLSRLWKDEPDAHRRTTQKSIELMLLAGFPIMVQVILFARPITSVIYGLKEFGPTVQVLQYLTAGLLFLYLDMVLGTTLLASDKQRQLSILALCAIPVNMGLNWYLIPYTQTTMGNGGIGASAATVLTELGIMTTAITLMPKGSFAGLRYLTLIKGLVAGIVMGSAIWFVQGVRIPWYILSVLGTTLYVTLLFAFRAFDEAEVAFLRSIANLESLKNLKRRIIP